MKVVVLSWTNQFKYIFFKNSEILWKTVFKHQNEWFLSDLVKFIMIM